MSEKQVGELYRAIDHLRKALRTFAPLPGPLSARELERHRGILTQVRPLVALAMGIAIPVWRRVERRAPNPDEPASEQDRTASHSPFHTRIMVER
jgi:hypothetical protein